MARDIQGSGGIRRDISHLKEAQMSQRPSTQPLEAIDELISLFLTNPWDDCWHMYPTLQSFTTEINHENVR